MKNRNRPAARLFAAIITISLFALPAAAAEPQPEADQILAEEHPGEAAKSMNTAAAPGTGAWEEVMETVHHDEEGHYESRKTGEKEVIDKEAWEEQVQHWFYECSVCGFRSEEGPSAVSDHILEAHPTGGDEHYYDPDGTEIYPSCREEYEIETIRHEAETHMEDVFEDVWIVDKEAYDEAVPTGVFRYVVDGEIARDTVLMIDGTPCYFNSEGTAFTEGVVTDRGEEYYFDGTELARDKWVTTGEGKFYYDARGKKATGIIHVNGKVYPLGDDGAAKKDRWVTVGGSRYYTDETGAAVTGWHKLNGRKYYFTDERYRAFREADRGKMMTGWASVGNRTYYFADSRYPAYTEAKEGIMLSGWKTIGGRKYYFMDGFYSDYREPDKGILMTGFRKINGKTYYLTDDRAAGYRDWKRGILVSGHVSIGGYRYFFTKTGVMAGNQFATADGAKYYYSGDGRMLRQSWVTVNGRKFYMDGSGKMYKGLLTLNGKKYYLGWNGVLVVNRRVTAEGKRYYADGSGELR